jgi:UDP:flavonoid glycosyltransferase YjiC (YdhE family)
MARRRRILFVSEAVTLAQVVRLVVLARSLPPECYEVHFAASRFDDLVFAPCQFRRWPIFSLPPAVVDRRVRSGRRLYGDRTLRRYLREDLRVIDAVRPDLVVGDLRLSLTVAAPLRQIPQVAVINAYWSPFAEREGFPLPEHPIVRLLGVRLCERYFPRALPAVFAHFAAPVNRLRRAHGLSEIGSLPEVLCHADLTLHPDPPELVPTRRGPPHHRHLGPLLWSPAIARPSWWSQLDPGRPTVYVTLGSSGRAELLPAVALALADLGAQGLLATAGRVELSSVPPGIHLAPYLPGEVAAARADLVLSNGGSTTSYQGLAAGRPVLGIASNLDQYLSMTAITRAGAGLLLRAGQATRSTIRTALAQALSDPTLRASAQRLTPTFASAQTEAPALFERALRALA